MILFVLINHTFSKNPPKSKPGGSQIEVWRGSGRLRGASWPLEASGRPQRRLREASWGPPGPFLAAKMVQVGFQNGAKIYKKSIPKSINCLMPLRIVIFLFFFDFGNQKPSHVGSKMHSKIDHILKRLKSPKRL